MDIAFLYPHSDIPYVIINSLHAASKCLQLQSLYVYAYSHVGYVHVTTQAMHPIT